LPGGVALWQRKAVAERTPWSLVGLAVGAGMVGAFQVGKVPVALGAIRAELEMGLVGAAWVLALFNLVGVGVGVAMGGLVACAGPRQMAVAGLLVMALAGLAGAAAPDPALLLLTRFAEGIGFLMAAVAIPSLIARLAAPGDVKLAFAFWGTYMPAGQAVMLFASPALLGLVGWRGLWLVNAAILALYAVPLWQATRRLVPAPPAPRGRLAQDLAATLRAPAPLALALAFACYSLQYLAVIGFLPTILVEREGLSTATAGLMTAFFPVANVVGNLLGGVLLHRGLPRWRLIAAASLVMATCGLGIFSLGLPLAPAYGLVLLFAAGGGMLPATVLGAVPVLAPAPRLVPAINGLLVQGSNLGQVIGPPAVGALAAATGSWQAAPVVLLAAALGSLAAALVLRRLELRLSPAAER
jgi:cyanate permease